MDLGRICHVKNCMNSITRLNRKNFIFQTRVLKLGLIRGTAVMKNTTFQLSICKSISYPARLTNTP